MAEISYAKEFGIFDIFHGNKYYLYSAVGDMGATRQLVLDLSPVVIIPDEKNSNKRPYLIDKDDLILDDIINTDCKSFNCKQVFSLDRMLLSLDYKLLRKDNYFVISKNGENSRRRTEELRYWFSCTRSRVSRTLLHKDKQIPRINVIPIADRISVDAQDAILKAFGRDGKNVLLWRSVAACIGIESILKQAGLKDGSVVEVLDCSSTGAVVTRITMHEVDNRLVPGHRIYYDCDTGKRKEENYPYEENYTYYDIYSGILPFSFGRKGELIPCSCIRKRLGSAYSMRKKPEYLIVIGDAGSFDPYIMSPSRIYIDKAGECIVEGAGRFANRMVHRILSYYDECDELSLVVFSKKEEVLFKTLIKGSDRLEGGLHVKNDRVDGVVLPKGSSEVRFYLRLGAPDRDKPLKVLSQKFTVDDELKANPREIALALYPSMVAGQGRAKVRITVANKDDNAIFKAVDLNWEEMRNALSKDENGNTIPETVDILEKNLERSFPVSVPAVRGSYDKFKSIRGDIESYLRGNLDIKCLNINKSSWPNIRAIGVEKFQRENVFGKEISGFGLPNVPEDRALAIRLFKNLNSTVLSNWNAANSYLTKIGWTYHGEFFPVVIDKILSEIEASARMFHSVAGQKFTICGNLLYNNEQLVRYMKAIMLRMRRNTDKISNWLRGTNLILYYNDDFLSDKAFTIDDFNILMSNLIDYYGYSSDRLKNISMTTMIFLLKVRKYYPDFCREDSTSSDDSLYDRLLKITFVDKYERTKPLAKLKSMLYKFLIGKGSLDLPSVDDDSDGDL